MTARAGLLAALLLTGCGTTVPPRAAPTASPPRTPCSAEATGHADPACTPGATNPAVTQATIGSTVCVAGWTATIRPATRLTSTLKRQQLAARGETADPAGYEEDHLIPLALGGAPADPANLWPQPWPAARRKDVDETALHRAVCAGRITLARAQAQILAKWR